MDNRNYCRSSGRCRNPSFSSSLLDEICRSIDQTPIPDDQKKVDRYVENIILDNKVCRKNSEYYCSNDIEAYYLRSFGFNSCSGSSDSGSGASFWTTSNSGNSKDFRSKSKLATRTRFSSQINHQQGGEKIYVSHRKLKNECGGFVKAKPKSLKTNSDLKKPKPNQPISPGSRLAKFLSSLFTSPGSAKKLKTQQAEQETKCNSAPTCSSASSISRSRFSKTPPSTDSKRSVRFSPLISVIVDQDYQNKNTEWRNRDYTPMTAVRNSICSGEEIRKNRIAREVLRNYSRKLNECLKMDEDKDEDDEDDCSSGGSSDLFELENLDCVMEREKYREELPVYGTTSVNANRAIANGLII